MDLNGLIGLKTDLEYEVRKLIKIIAVLRSPKGCPWDQQQTKTDIGKYLIDEAYEVIDAIDEGNSDHLKEELGDLLFHIFFLANIAEESGEFNMADVVRGITEKMTRRHPHVFGNIKVNNVEEIKKNWEDIKREERKGMAQPDTCSIADVGNSLPSLLHAFRVTKRASDFGFDWGKTAEVFEKLEEETAELEKALAEGKKKHIEAEIGDIFFTLVNLSRFEKVNPEAALKSSVRKFIKRFSFVEKHFRKCPISSSASSMEEMNRLWNISKENERKNNKL